MGGKRRRSENVVAPPPPPTVLDHIDAVVKSIKEDKDGTVKPTATLMILTLIVFLVMAFKRPKTKSKAKRVRTAKGVADAVADGNVLCAIVAKADPKAIDLSAMKAMDSDERLQAALDAAEKHLNVEAPPPDQLSDHDAAAQYVTQLKRASVKLVPSLVDPALSLQGQGSLAVPASPEKMLSRSRGTIHPEEADETPPPLAKGSSKVEHQNPAVTAAVAATFVEEVTAEAAAGAPGASAPAAAARNPNIERIKVVVNKERLESKVGVELTRDPSDNVLVVTKIGSSGAAARKACQLEGKLAVGDRVRVASGYTNVVHLDTHADKFDPPTAHLTCHMLRISVGLVRLRLKRRRFPFQVVSMTLQKERQADAVGVSLISQPGDKHPHVTKVAKGSRAAGQVMEGDLLLSVEAATTHESVNTATAHAATGNGLQATALFLSSALGPITFEVDRMIGTGVAQAAVASLTAAVDPADKEDADAYGRTRMSVIAAVDVASSKGGTDDTLTAADLERVGLGPKELQAEAQSSHEIAAA